MLCDRLGVTDFVLLRVSFLLIYWVRMSQINIYFISQVIHYSHYWHVENSKLLNPNDPSQVPISNWVEFEAKFTSLLGSIYCAVVAFIYIGLNQHSCILS